MNESKGDNITYLRALIEKKQNDEEKPVENKNEFFEKIKTAMIERGIPDDVVFFLEEKQNSIYSKYNDIDLNDQVIIKNKIEHIAQLSDSEADRTVVLESALQILRTKH